MDVIAKIRATERFQQVSADKQSFYQTLHDKISDAEANINEWAQPEMDKLLKARELGVI